jgi:hypothetical protein
MAGARPTGPNPLDPSRRPIWRRPSVFILIALFAILMVVWFARTGEPQKVTAQAEISPPATGAEVQWPDLIEENAVSTTENQTAAAPVEAPGRTFIAKLNLQPRLVNGQLRGFVVRPEDPSILEGTPLQSGDVLLEVDGLELDAARAAAMANNVGDYQDVFIRFERGNVGREGILPLGTH